MPNRESTPSSGAISRSPLRTNPGREGSHSTPTGERSSQKHHSACGFPGSEVGARAFIGFESDNRGVRQQFLPGSIEASRRAHIGKHQLPPV
jgi:hypothetical protein